MSRTTSLLFGMLFVSLGTGARAQLTAIHRDRIPQSVTVQSALDDAQALEPYADRWTAQWQFPVTKEQTAARLGMDLGALETASRENPGNEELLLLTALVAHYAYNVDVEHSRDVVLAELTAAEKLGGSDVRPAWFRADFLCQTEQPDQGAEGFMAIEAAHPGNTLPASFWDGYERCAAVTNMPAHLLRAADHLTQMSAEMTADRKFYADLGRGRFDAVDLGKSYDAKQVWSARDAGTAIEFTATACGLRMRVPEAWKMDRLDMQKGSCVAMLGTGPYAGLRGPLAPEILVIVKQPEGNETLEAFEGRFTTKGTYTPMTAPHCPAASCLAAQGVLPGTYRKDGGGRPRIVVFERDQPDYPGLLFETPYVPHASKPDEAQYFRPNRTLERIPGKLYYLVTLDTASSIEQDAMKDYQIFLENLVVE
jgi:hypothetical protein